MEQPFVSVIIPVRNDPRIRLTLEALQTQTYPTDKYEVIVVDDGSTDDTWSIVNECNVTSIKSTNDANNAFVARNVGITQAKGDVFAFTDADCLPQSDWIEAGVRALAEHDLAGGQIEMTINDPTSASQYYDAITFLQHDVSIPKRSVAFTGNLFVKKSVLDAIGPFPSDLYCSADITFTKRAVQNGFALGYAADAVVQHPARRFISLLKKAVRVGLGVREGRSQPKASSPMLCRPQIRHLNPVLLQKRLIEKNYHVSGLLLLRMWLIAWLVIVCCGIGWVTMYREKSPT